MQPKEKNSSERESLIFMQKQLSLKFNKINKKKILN